MSEPNPQLAIKKLTADREKLLDTLQILLRGAETFFEPGNKMASAPEATIELQKAMKKSQELLNEMKQDAPGAPH